MSLILAIEPDRRQAAKLSTIARELIYVELVIGETTEKAFEALGARIPDLVLTSLLLSPKDESALADRLRELDAAGKHVQTLVIPVLGGRDDGGRRSGGGFFGLLRRGPAKGTTDGCDPVVFADQVKEYLERAAAERAAAAAAQADRDADWSEEPPPSPRIVAEPVPAVPQPEFFRVAPAEDYAPSVFEYAAPSRAVDAEPDFSEQLRAHLSPSVDSLIDPPVVEQAPVESGSSWPAVMTEPEFSVAEPVYATPSHEYQPAVDAAAYEYQPTVDAPSYEYQPAVNLLSVDSPAPLYQPPVMEPAPVATVIEPAVSIGERVAPVSIASPVPIDLPEPAILRPPVAPVIPMIPAAEEEWEEISLDVVSDTEPKLVAEREPQNEIVSEVVDLEALMRELHAAESDGTPDPVPVKIDATLAPLEPPVVETPRRPNSLDLDSFTAELKLAAKSLVPEPPPEPLPAPPPPARPQPAWGDLLTAIRRDINKRPDEAPAAAPPKRTPALAFEPLVFPQRPAPAAQALAEVDSFVSKREAPIVASPVVEPVAIVAPEAIESQIKKTLAVVALDVAPPSAVKADPPRVVVADPPAIDIAALKLAVAPAAVAPKPLEVVAPPAEEPRPEEADPPRVVVVSPPAIDVAALEFAVAPAAVAAKPLEVVAPPAELVVPAPVVAAPLEPVVVVAPPEVTTPPPVVIAVAPIVVDEPLVVVEPPSAMDVVSPRSEKPAAERPSPLDVLSSLGLEPVDVLVPDPVEIPDPVFVQPIEAAPVVRQMPESETLPTEASPRRSKIKKKRRHEERQPAATAPDIDDWGFFDPQKIGFGALLSKLDKFADHDDRAANRR